VHYKSRCFSSIWLQRLCSVLWGILMVASFSSVSAACYIIVLDRWKINISIHVLCGTWIVIWMAGLDARPLVKYYSPFSEYISLHTSGSDFLVLPFLRILAFQRYWSEADVTRRIRLVYTMLSVIAIFVGQIGICLALCSSVYQIDPRAPDVLVCIK